MAFLFVLPFADLCFLAIVALLFIQGAVVFLTHISRDARAPGLGQISHVGLSSHLSDRGFTFLVGSTVASTLL